MTGRLKRKKMRSWEGEKVRMTGRRERKKMRSWEGEKVGRKWDPSSSQKNGTMPRQGCGSGKRLKPLWGLCGLGGEY
jgi:hypothetical protein